MTSKSIRKNVIKGEKWINRASCRQLFHKLMILSKTDWIHSITKEMSNHFHFFVINIRTVYYSFTFNYNRKIMDCDADFHPFSVKTELLYQILCWCSSRHRRNLFVVAHLIKWFSFIHSVHKHTLAQCIKIGLFQNVWYDSKIQHKYLSTFCAMHTDTTFQGWKWHNARHTDGVEFFGYYLSYGILWIFMCHKNVAFE